MGQQASQFLDCRFLRRDNTSQIKHQQLLNDLTLMQKENDQKRVLSLKQRQKSMSQMVSRQSPLVHQKPIVIHDHILKYSEQSFPKSMEYESGGFIEIPQVSLSDILSSRLNTNQFLPANDIHCILGGLLSAMSYLQTNNISHHDIYPSSIYYSNNRYKFSNPITTQSSYQRTFNQKRFSYLSPQLIEALVNNVVIDDHTLLFKPDVYSFGMVMLEVCSLQSSSQCYDPQTYTITQSVIKNRLPIIQNKYGVGVSSLINIMLQQDPKKRLSAAQVHQIFQKPQQNNNRMILKQSVEIPNPVSILKNSHKPPLPPQQIPNKQIMLNSSNPERMTRQYNIVVSPPPTTTNLNNSLRTSTLANSSRPPTFDPNVQIVRRNSLNNHPVSRIINQPNQPINLQQIDNRIDRILANSRKY